MAVARKHQDRQKSEQTGNTYKRILNDMTNTYAKGIARRLNIEPSQVKTDVAQRWARSWISAFVDVSKLDERPILNLVFSTVENMRTRIQTRRAQIRKFIGNRRNTTSDEESYIVDEFEEFEEEAGAEYEEE